MGSSVPPLPARTGTKSGSGEGRISPLPAPHGCVAPQEMKMVGAMPVHARCCTTPHADLPEGGARREKEKEVAGLSAVCSSRSDRASNKRRSGREGIVDPAPGSRAGAKPLAFKETDAGSRSSRLSRTRLSLPEPRPRPAYPSRAALPEPRPLCSGFKSRW